MMVKIFGKTLCLVLLVSATISGGLALWLDLRDPVQSLPPPAHGLEVTTTLLALGHRRHVEHIILHSEQLGDIGFTLSLPDPLPSEKLPLIFVLGGLGTGENNIRYITEPGHNAIVGYDWPMPIHFPSGSDFLIQAPDLYHQVMNVPGQAASVIDWLYRQPWTDRNRISVLGFSLGALAAPSIEDVAAHDGHSIGWTIIAYGGAPLGAVFAANPRMRPTWMRDALAPMIDLVLHPLEPTLHLPHLSGHFLVLEGRDDGLIPATTRARLRDAVPQPKDIITFEGNHLGVGPDKMALLQKIIEKSRNWLVENGAVNAK
jgi:hypothetical protein